MDEDTAFVTFFVIDRRLNESELGTKYCVVDFIFSCRHLFDLAG